MRIVKLSPEVADKIAAGEVVERPASVVKELVENSIDAGAQSVRVGVAGGGLEMISVSDDGCGMSREDASLAFARHATSKISRADDLFSITTLGFRGEALPSIASVAKVRLITRERGAAEGTVVTAEGGSVSAPAPAGAPEGATITVCDLFYNTPARLKYLRSPATETRRIIDILGRLALAHPEVSFSLTVDGRNVLSTPHGGSLREAAAAVLGVDLARCMAPVDKTTSGITVRGLAGPADYAKSGRDVQHVLVNGRPVSCKTVWAAIDRAYDRSVPAGKKAPVVLSITLDPSAVDVNVHPAKSEVRFASESDVYRAVHAAVSAALRSMEAAPDIGRDLRGGAARLEGAATVDAIGGFGSGTRRRDAPDGENARLWPGATYDGGSGYEPGDGQSRDSMRGPRGAMSGPAGPIFVIGQLASAYILAEADSGLLIIDQHVAHERVLVEEYRRRLAAGTAGDCAQLLLSPEPVELGAVDADLVARHQATLARMGFEVDLFGPGTVLVRGIPFAAVEMAPKDALAAAVEGIAAAPTEADPESLADHVAVSLACHGAVKAGAVMRHEEMEALIQALMECEDPMRCPHGRPVILTISTTSLERSFGRR